MVEAQEDQEELEEPLLSESGEPLLDHKEKGISRQEKLRRIAEYNRAYYRRNAKLIGNRRKARYANDPEFREKVLKARKDSLALARAKKANLPSLPVRHRASKKVRIQVGDDIYVVGLLTIGQASERLGLSRQTLRLWETQRVLPKVTVETEGGHRLYTEDQVIVIQEVYAKYKAAQVGRWELTQKFVSELHARWNALPNGVDTTKRQPLPRKED